MKKKVYLIFLSGVLMLSVSFAGTKNDSVSVTYIANCGFLVEIDSKKILIDALFNEGFNHYVVPDSSTIELINSNKKPFNGIDLVLVTHKHGDHFDPEMLLSFMLGNPDAKLICPAQVIEMLSQYEKEYNKIKSNIINASPELYSSELIEVDGLEIYACRLMHGHVNNKDIQNIAYLVSFNGKSFFHTGDADPHQVIKYSGIKLSDRNITVGLINDGFGNMQNASITREFINAQNNVTMHLPEQIAKIWLEPLKEQPDLFSNPFVFTRSSEQKTFFGY